MMEGGPGVKRGDRLGERARGWVMADQAGGGPDQWGCGLSRAARSRRSFPDSARRRKRARGPGSAEPHEPPEPSGGRLGWGGVESLAHKSKDITFGGGCSVDDERLIETDNARHDGRQRPGLMKHRTTPR